MAEISVIVPVYKVEKYLNRCVDSILNQTFKDFECILIDDGSPDKCGEICDEYSKQDSRVKVIHQINQGLGPARNSGLKIATGQYICFVDSDDWVEPDYLKIMEKHIRQNDVDIVMSSYRMVFFDEAGKRRDEDNKPEKSGLVNQTDAILQMLISRGYYTTSWNKLIKRECIYDENNIFYPFENVYGEDERWWMGITSRIHSAYLEPTILYNWVRRSDSICGLHYYDYSVSKSLLDMYDNAKLRICWLSEDKRISILTRAHFYSVGVTLCERAYFSRQLELYQKTWREIRKYRKFWLKTAENSLIGKIKRILLDILMAMHFPRTIVKEVSTLGGRK